MLPLLLGRGLCLQVVSCDISLFTGALQLLLAPLQASRSVKLDLEEGGNGKAALEALRSTCQELHDVLAAPAHEFALLKQFPYAAIGGVTLAGRLEGAVRELSEVRSAPTGCAAAGERSLAYS